MKTTQLAAQLYTARDLLKTPADIAKTLRRVREAGYTAVQLSALGPIETPELLKILSDEGLTCCATHEPGADIINDTQKVIDRLKSLDCRYTAYPFPSGVDMAELASVKKLAQDLDRAGAALREAGQVLTYHNHAHEFFRHGDKLVLDILMEESSPENLQAELDTYWVQVGGCDPVAYCEKLAGRLPLLHMKDYKVGPGGTPTMCEIGAGTLDFPAIIAAAEKGGCEWFIIEQDVCPGDPVDSLKQSYEYAAEHFTS